MKGVRRPRIVVLPESAQIPPRNLITPPPNRFTHEVKRRQPFYFQNPGTRAADGYLASGTKVVLMVEEEGPYCRIADGQGLYVVTALKGLRPLSSRRVPAV